MSCSALKRAYRDQLRRHAPQTEFLHLYGTPEVIGGAPGQQAGHFMPASLLQSQFDTLEPLDPDEGGLLIDVDQNVGSIVDDYVSRTRPGELMITILADAPKLTEPIASGTQLILAFLAASR
jgi:gluconokinase